MRLIAEPLSPASRHRRRAAAVLGFAGLFTFLAAHAQSDAPRDERAARNIVEKADRIRFPAEAFQVNVSIVTSSGGQATDARRYQVLSRDGDSTIVMVTEPAVDRGQIMLIKGRDLWVFLPNVSQPVRLSLSQRLTGQVANGDIARANFSGDYHPKVLRVEKVDGEDHHVIELTAVDRSVTYSRVLYWVKQSNHFPHKAEFYSLSDRLLKTCRYENFQVMAGKLRPTRLVLQDALRNGEESVLDYSGMMLKDLPEKMFTRDYLKRL